MADSDGFNGPRRSDESGQAGFGTLLNELREIRARLADMERGAPLRTAGIGLSEQGMSVSRSLEVNGDLAVSGGADFTGSTTIGGNLEVTGAASIGGATTLSDTLTVEGDGRIVSRYPNSVAAAFFGPVLDEGTGDPAGYGVLIQRSDGADVLLAKEDENGDRVAAITTDTRFFATGGGGYTVTTSNPANEATHAIYTSGADQIYRAPTRHYFFTDSGGTGLHVIGNISASGSKPFIIDHPLHEDLSLVHAATETPIAAIEYPWPEPVTLDENGEAKLDLPDYFEALAADDYRAVWVQPVGHPFATGADPVVEGRTTVYGDPGRQVFVKVSARRGDDAGQFDVEIPRIQPPAEPEERP